MKKMPKQYTNATTATNIFKSSQPQQDRQMLKKVVICILGRKYNVDKSMQPLSQIYFNNWRNLVFLTWFARGEGGGGTDK